MKQKLLNLLAIFVAFLSAIPIANAAEITFSIDTTPLWEKLGHYEAAKTIAVSNNMLYVLADPTKQTTIAYVGQNTNWTTFESGYGTWAHGFAFDNDDAGNIVMQGNGTGSATTKLIVYPAGATSNASKKEITITSPGGRTDFIRIQGNILSGTAYVWFVPANTQKIIRVKIVNGKEDSRTEWTHTLGNASSTEIAYMLDDGRIYLHHRKGSPNYAYILTVPANGGAVTSSEEVLSGYSASNLTSDIFNIQGTYFHVYNAGNEGQDIRFNVKNLSTGAILASNITPFNGEKWDKSGTSNLSNFNSIGTIIRPIKVNVNTVDLYCFTPEHGASVYRVTATIKAEGINSPKATISNETNVVVSWSKPTTDVPTNYSVSYSSDGTNWSTPVVTSNLSHTFNNLSPGSYTFKIVPYYEQYLTYGAEAKTSNIEIVIVKGAPITNLTYEYIKNDGANAGRQDISLKWSAPTGMTGTSVAGYKVYHEGNLLASLNADELTYTHQGVTKNATYKVVPIFDGIAEDASYGAEITTTEVTAPAPTGYKFIVTKKWEAEGTLNNDGDKTTPAGKSIAVSNEVLYVSAMNQYSTISYVNKDQYPSWPNFPSGYNKGAFGYGMDNDDAGNIIVAANSVGSGNPTKFAVYPAGATSNANKKEITLSGEYLPGARADYIGTQGNIYNGTGYLWLAQNATNTIKRIKLENKSGVPTPTGITTWSHNFTNNSSEVIIRPLEDGRIYYHDHQNECKIITLPENGGEIPAANVETISLSQTQTDNFSSDAIILKGNVLNIRNAGIDAQDISFEIYNITAKGFVTYNDQQVITPFEGVRTDDTTNPLSGISKIGSIVRAVKVDDETVDVYVYSPFHGASCYRIGTTPIYVVTGPLTSLVYEYLEVPTDEGTRRDIKLTWGAPEGDAPTSYRIYRGETLIATVDGSELTYTNEKVNANYTYTVIPYYDGVPEDESLGKSVTTTEVETVIYAPIITEMRTYNGYSIAQFFFKMPSLSTIKPVSFNIYRGDQLIESGITQYNYIDDGLPKISEDKEYTYYVEAVYSDKYNNVTRKSLGEPVKITYRDWALAGYMIEEIYNVPINQAIGNLPNNFTNYDYYRQGQFYNGHWYIAQRADDLCQKDQDKANGITNSVRDDMKSDNADATGGVVVIKATEEPDVRMGFTGKILTNDAFENVGIAMDDKGTIFMRNNNVTKLAATTPSDGNATEVAKLHDGFGRRITEGHLYTRNADGSYSATPTTLDLQALWLDDRWIDDMVYTSGKSYGQVAGRSDYYHMWGDVMSAEGGYLILAPSWTRTAFKVKIVNGAYVSHEKIEFSDYTEANPTTGELEEHILATGSENYGFKIAGRDAWMAQIRSNGYFGVHDEGNGQIDWHAIFDTDSRINNSGGTSIVAFGNAADDSDGETFLITPACMYSRNTGDFIVTRGIKDNIGDAASESKLSPPMPVAQFKQINISSNIATNANGNWFHAEPGTYESATDANAECVYIYQYVPGMRFAKYRLFPDNQLPQVTPTLEITTKYDNAENPTEITHFGGVSTWKRPKKFGLSDASNANVKVKSYSFELLNAKGEVVYEDEVLDKDYAAGTNPTEESELFVYEFDYVSDKNIENVDNCDLDFQTYTARVAVNYEFSNGTIKQSQFNSAIDNNDYTAKPAEELYIEAFVAEDITIGGWTQKEDGSWVVETQKADRYRIDLDFSKPKNAEPVSYYTIKAVVNKIGEYKGDTINIENFLLHNGSEIKDGKLWAKTTSTSQIPGTYDFENAKAPYYTTVDDNGDGLYDVADGGSRQNVVLSYFYDVPVNNDGIATVANGDEVVINNTPDEWEFIIVAHYAARNTYIDKSKLVGITPKGLTPTGVEVVGDDNILAVQIYPIPAHSTITVKSSEAINSIVIYNEAGVEVMNLNGDGETIATVNIEDLATGFYFVKVNNNAPVKILKK